ncbi:MAG: hypothetical protein ACHP7D_06305 [Lysobacterales bacterium]
MKKTVAPKAPAPKTAASNPAARQAPQRIVTPIPTRPAPKPAAPVASKPATPPRPATPRPSTVAPTRAPASGPVSPEVAIQHFRELLREKQERVRLGPSYPAPSPYTGRHDTAVAEGEEGRGDGTAPRNDDNGESGH